MLQVIGEGASSKVHLGKYLSNGMIVAVKLINLSSSKLVENTSNSQLLKLVRNEFDIMKAVGQHPNIVRLDQVF